MVADEEPHPTGRKGAAKGSIKAGARTAPAWCPNEGTAVAQWPPRLAPPRLSPWQSCSCSLHTPSLVVGYLDNQLKDRSPAKLGPPSVLLMGSSPPDPVLSGAPACGPAAPPPLACVGPSLRAHSSPAASCGKPHLSPLGSVHYPRCPPSGWFCKFAL